MLGPLPTRYRYFILVTSMLACLGLALWLAGTVALPVGGYLVGLLAGGAVAFALLHDFSHRSAR
jgi:hypothetical protein